VAIKHIKVPRVDEGQKAIGENQRCAVDVNEIDNVHQAAPETEMPENRWDDDFLRLLRMDPLQDEASAKREAGEEAQRGPPAGTVIEPRKIRADKRCEKTFG
jgi:hypothetical protein